MSDRVLIVLSAFMIVTAAVLALGMGEWTKGTYFMANAAVLIGVTKL